MYTKRKLAIVLVFTTGIVVAGYYWFTTPHGREVEVNEAPPDVAPLNRIGDDRPKVDDERIVVLVARADLSAGISIFPGDVCVRELRPEERDQFNRKRASALPPDESAANWLVPRMDIRAESVLLRTDFLDGSFNPASRRLEAGMTAVAVEISGSVARFIRANDQVDVWRAESSARMACLDHNARVIMKRQITSDPMRANAFSFVLQVHSDRARLIESSISHGL
jgi:Flp pilus assembly protein CpaB